MPQITQILQEILYFPRPGAFTVKQAIAALHISDKYIRNKKGGDTKKPLCQAAFQFDRKVIDLAALSQL